MLSSFVLKIILILLKFLTSVLCVLISATYGWVNPRVSIHLRHLSGICHVVCFQRWGIYHKRSSREKGIFLVEFTFAPFWKRKIYFKLYNCGKPVAPSPLSICSFPTWCWGRRVDGHAWNGLSKPFCHKFTSMLIGVLQINYDIYFTKRALSLVSEMEWS